MKQYSKLLQNIKDRGTLKTPARENMPSTLSLFGYQFRHDLQEGFPLLTTKKLSFKNIVVELLWFLRGDTNVKFLIDNGCNIWNEDAYNYYIKICKINKTDASLMYSYEEFVNHIKLGNVNILGFDDYTLGDCGFQYGKVWRAFGDSPNVYDEVGDFVEAGTEGVDQIRNLIEGLKNNPQSRRHIVTAVDPSNDKSLALYWCHSMFQFNCRPLSLKDRENLYHEKGFHIMIDGEDVEKAYHEFYDSQGVPKYYLDCQMYQRSADVFLGVPYNIASYALLTHIIAKLCNMVPGEYIHTFGDVHIYDNHMDQVDEQLSREPKELPSLEIQNDLNWNYDFDDILYNLNVDDWLEELKLVNYDPHPRIKAKLSTGLK